MIISAAQTVLSKNEETTGKRKRSESKRKRSETASLKMIPSTLLARSSLFLLASFVAFHGGTMTRTAHAFLPAPILPFQTAKLACGKLSSTASASSEAASSTNSNFKRPDVLSPRSESLAEVLLGRIRDESAKLGREHAEMFGLDESENDEQLQTSAGMFALLDAIKKTLGADGALGLSGYPLVLRKAEI